MVRLNKCGHPDHWVFRLTGAGKKFSYCLGCLIEKTEIDNFETYKNPFLKSSKKIKPITKEKK